MVDPIFFVSPISNDVTPPLAQNTILNPRAQSGQVQQEGVQVLTATVLRADASGKAAISLPSLGEFLVETGQPLQAGQRLTLQVLSGALSAYRPAGSEPLATAPFEAKVVAINGQPPAATPSAGTSAGTGEKPVFTQPFLIRSATEFFVLGDASRQATAAPSAPLSVPTETVEQGRFLDAVVLRPDSSAGPLLSRILNPQSVKNPYASTQAQTAPQLQLQAADTLRIRVLSVQQPTGSVPVNATLQTPVVTPGSVVVQASVIGAESGDALVLHTPFGTLRVAPVVQLPAQTLLQLEVTAVQLRQPLTAEAQQLIEAAELEQLTQLSRYRALESLQNTLLQLDTELGVHSHARHVPDVRSPDFVARLFWFLMQAQKGDAETWLGQETTQLLQRIGKEDLIQRLGKEFGMIRGAYAEPVGQQWQHILMPIFDGVRMHYAHVYVRRDKKHSVPQGQNEEARFLIEVDMDLTGPLQLDGFSQSPARAAGQKSLDLHIRAQRELESGLRLSILQLFSDTIEVLGIKGHLQFHIVEVFPESVKQVDEEDSAHGSIIV